MKNQFIRSIKTFLAIVLVICVFVPALGNAKAKAINDIPTDQRASTENFFNVLWERDQAIPTANAHDRACPKSARNARCNQPIDYKSANPGKDSARDSECKWSVLKGRCNRVIRYKSLNVAYTNSECKWSALKARCNRTTRSITPAKIQVAIEMSECKKSARSGRCQQPIQYRSSTPQIKVAGSDCQWSARSGRCAKETGSSHGNKENDNSHSIALSASGQCVRSARNGRCNRQNLATSLSAGDPVDTKTSN